jgi:hypothetical protein
MSRWAIYDANGRIDRVFSGPDSVAPTQAQGDEQAISIDDSQTDENAYVANGAIVDKAAFSLTINKTEITANGTDEAVISGIPEGVQVEWPDGQTDIVTGGEIRFSVDLPGTYTFQFTAIPYLDKEVTIEAIAAP